jgi:hypothetical protein
MTYDRVCPTLLECLTYDRVCPTLFAAPVQESRTIYDNFLDKKEKESPESRNVVASKDSGRGGAVSEGRKSLIPKKKKSPEDKAKKGISLQEAIGKVRTGHHSTGGITLQGHHFTGAIGKVRTGHHYTGGHRQGRDGVMYMQ